MKRQVKDVHYAARLKKRIRFLEECIRDYYMVNYRAKEAIGEDPGICLVTILERREDPLVPPNFEMTKRIIKDLPLWDCGC